MSYVVRSGICSTILVIILLALAPPAAPQVPNEYLTGVYTADDGSVYYVRQIGTALWWAGMSAESELGVQDFHLGLQFTNVFHGTISDNNNTIDGVWADVPRGSNGGSGRLTLRFSYLGNVSASFEKIPQMSTGGFGPSRWTKRIVINSNPAACENASSTNIVCKFDRVTKSNGGTLLHGGDLVPFKDNVVVFGQVITRSRLENDEDWDFTFNMQVERSNWSGTGLDQLLGPDPGRFWTEGWLPGISLPVCVLPNQLGCWPPDLVGLAPPDRIRRLLDRYVSNIVHVEVIRYGSTGPGGAGTGAVLLPGWAQNGANGVLVNGQPVNGDVVSNDVLKEADIKGHYLGPSSPAMRVRVTGVLVLDCGHSNCIGNVEIHPVYSIDILNEPFIRSQPGRTGTLTGAWAANDEGTYYVRQVGTTVWWLGLSRDRGRSFANVFHGTIQGNTITGDWADVPLGGFARGNGHLSLLGAGGGASTTRLVKDGRASTIGFSAQLWEKLYDQQFPPRRRVRVQAPRRHPG